MFSRTLSTMFFPLTSTCMDSVRRRAPLQAGQTSSENSSFVPRPLQVGQAPYGELNEKRRGSISWNANPSSGQEKRELMSISDSSSKTAFTVSLPRSSAISTASARRDRSCLFCSTGQPSEQKDRKSTRLNSSHSQISY